MPLSHLYNLCCPEREAMETYKDLRTAGIIQLSWCRLLLFCWKGQDVVTMYRLLRIKLDRCKEQITHHYLLLRLHMEFPSSVSLIYEMLTKCIIEDCVTWVENCFQCSFGALWGDCYVLWHSLCSSSFPTISKWCIEIFFTFLCLSVLKNIRLSGFCMKWEKWVLHANCVLPRIHSSEWDRVQSLFRRLVQELKSCTEVSHTISSSTSQPHPLTQAPSCQSW